MDNHYIASATSLALTSDLSEKIGFSIFDSTVALGGEIEEFEASMNLDMRAIARSHDDIGVVFWSIMKAANAAPFDAVVKQNPNDMILALMAFDRTRFLIHSMGTEALYDIALRTLGYQSGLNFVNNYGLITYERFIRGKFGPHSLIPYSTYAIADLGESLPEEDKFTLILSSAPMIIGDDSLLQTLIDSLAPGGTLIISQSNHARFIYNSAYFADSYYPMHQILLSNNGITFHLNSVAGQTIFRKNL